MNEKEFKLYLQQKKQIVDERLPVFIKKLGAPEKLKEAMLYSLKAGGKRLRPILLFATMDAFEKEDSHAIDIACSLEMLHTYSLIHDDLPSMDDDNLRRGMPTNHVVYGEALAILAGDALLTHSFELIACTENPLITDSMKVQLINLLSKAAGPEGMVGGQVSDLEAELQQVPLEKLELIHENKTGKLLSYAVLAGAILSKATTMQMDYLQSFAFHLGLAFQIKDDILDVEGDEAILGKPIGSDTEKNKSTYPTLLTLSGAKKKCNEHYEISLQMLQKANVDVTLLEKLAEYIIKRES